MLTSRSWNLLITFSVFAEGFTTISRRARKLMKFSKARDVKNFKRNRFLHFMDLADVLFARRKPGAGLKYCSHVFRSFYVFYHSYAYNVSLCFTVFALDPHLSAVSFRLETFVKIVKTRENLARGGKLSSLWIDGFRDRVIWCIDFIAYVTS